MEHGNDNQTSKYPKGINIELFYKSSKQTEKTAVVAWKNFHSKFNSLFLNISCRQRSIMWMDVCSEQIFRWTFFLEIIFAEAINLCCFYFFTLYSYSCAVPPNILDMESTPSSVAVRENQNINLTCRADGFPTPKIIWRREDGQSITVERKKKGLQV